LTCTYRWFTIACPTLYEFSDTEILTYSVGVKDYWCVSPL